MIKITNGEKLISDFPYIEIKGQDEVFTTIQIDTVGTGTPILVYTEWWNAEYLEPTTKNDLPCGEKMEFPDTFEEFVEQYGFIDSEEIYTNASWLIPVFRVKQLLEYISTTKNDLGVSSGLENVSSIIDWNNCHTSEQLDSISTTKNDLGVDCIDRVELLKAMDTWDKFGYTETGCFVREPKGDYVPYVHYEDMVNCVKGMPSVIPQELRWIPVSEKLPEPFMYVNATCRSLIDDRENWVVETIYLPIPKEVNKHGYSDWGNIPMLNWGKAEVIAWVERIIPQPYKAESEG